MSNKPHVSKTQLEMLAKCPAQYEQRYVLGRKRPPGVALVLGSSVHEGAEADLRSKMEHGELLDEEAVTEYAADALKRRWKEEEPVRGEDDPDEGEAVDEVVSLTAIHHRELAPLINPVAVEEIRLLETSLSHDIMMVVDVREADAIRDLKTKGKAPPADEAKTSIQGQLETLEAKVAGRGALPFKLDFLVRGKKKPLAQVYTPTEDDHRSVLTRVERSVALINAGAFPPAMPGSWWCSAKWCGWWSDCAWGARQRVSVGLIDPARLTSRVLERRP